MQLQSPQSLTVRWHVVGDERCHLQEMEEHFLTKEMLHMLQRKCLIL